MVKKLTKVAGSAEKSLNRHFWRRLSRITIVWRKMLSWIFGFSIALIAGLWQLTSLGNYYLQTTPITGGTLTVGMLGVYTNSSPIFAAGAANTIVSELVFDGLFGYDDSNKLVSKIASGYSVDEKGLKYTVTINPLSKWHDGKNVSADDVVFTVGRVQNATVKSPYISSWQGVKVSKVDDLTVIFELNSPLTSFLHNLTVGLIPAHLLDSVPPSELRANSFGGSVAVGNGPFILESAEVLGIEKNDREESVTLVANPNYYAGAPNLSKIVVRSFNDQSILDTAIKNKEIDLSLNETNQIKEQKTVDTAISGGVYMFFKTTIEPFNSVVVRKAMSLAVDRNAVVAAAKNGATTLIGPLPESQASLDLAKTQVLNDPAAATSTLEADGWILNSITGTRSKNGNVFSARLYTQQEPSLVAVSQVLQSAWSTIGMPVEVVYLSEEELQNGPIARHEYDMLLYGVSFGSDADVYPYWHSSQADPRSLSRLNFSEYSNSAVDKSLEAARSKEDKDLKVAKLQPFINQWNTDYPAIALFTPSLQYYKYGDIFGMNKKQINRTSDLFDSVEKWMIRTKKSNKI
jgi:peptide/nickel transport system substrate-binding protein